MAIDAAARRGRKADPRGTVEIWGIKNCDTVRRARVWLTENGVAHVFHDYREEGLAPERLAGWVARVGWQKLLNKSSTSYRALPEATKAGLDEDKASAVMLAETTAIKRPVLALSDGRLLVGFDPATYREWLLPKAG